MSRALPLLSIACGLSIPGWAARCTTILDPRLLPEYDRYVEAAEQAMAAHLSSGELAWAPVPAARDAAGRLAAGKPVRYDISDTALNRRIAGADGTIIHWAGAVRIRDATLAMLESVLQDYERYDRIYRPMVFRCRATRRAGEPAIYDAVMGLHSVYRFASLFPQHYAFQVRARIDYSRTDAGALNVHLRADEVRESDSGVPGRDDLLERYHDHGIMWALNAWWRAVPRASGLYFEFETITLARSAQEFSCRIGFLPMPKSIVADAMQSLPAESVAVILEGTKSECERRAGITYGRSASDSRRSSTAENAAARPVCR